MIEINADSCNFGDETHVEVSVKIHAVDKKRATKELFYILKALDKKYPKLLMDAIDLHINDICDEIMQEGGEDD